MCTREFQVQIYNRVTDPAGMTITDNLQKLTDCCIFSGNSNPLQPGFTAATEQGVECVSAWRMCVCVF